MRRIIAVLSGAIALCGQLYSQKESSVLLFDEKIFDFGTVEEKNGVVSHIFIFKNTGETPVAIDEIVSGCGCTDSEFSEVSVEPGKKGRITITFNPLYRPGPFSKEIIVLSNNRKETNRIWIKGSVIPFLHPVEEDYPYYFGEGLHLSLKVLAFGKIRQDECKRIKLRYSNETDSLMDLKFSVDGDNSDLKFSNPGKLSPRQRGEVYFYYNMSKKRHEGMAIFIYPVVNGKKLSQPFEATITRAD